MVAIYDYSNFPLVKVDLSGSINTNDDFQNFTSQWLELYKLHTYFEFEFDTINTGYINPLYCLYTAFFIKSIKKQNPQYLKKSKIYVYNRYIFKLAKYIFYIEPPVAPVELILVNKNNSNYIEYFYPSL